MLAAVALALALTLAPPLPAESPLKPRRNPFGEPVRSPKATTSRAARQSALRSIPFDKLDANARAKVSSVLPKVSVFRRLPIRVVQCDPDLYLFLVRHPDVIVNIWDVLGITQMTMQQTGPTTFQVADYAGTTGSIEYLHHSHDTHLIYAEGSYDGPLNARPVRGRGLMILKTGYVREPDGRYYITSRLDVFMHVEHLGVELLARTFQPLVGKVADINFTQTVAFIGSLSRTAEMNRPGVQRLADKLSKVQPEVREQFALVARRVAQKTTETTDSNVTAHPLIAERPAEGKTE